MIAVIPDHAASDEECQGVEDGEDDVADAISVKVIFHGPVMAIGIEGDHNGGLIVDAVPECGWGLLCSRMSMRTVPGSEKTRLTHAHDWPCLTAVGEAKCTIIGRSTFQVKVEFIKK